MPDFVFGKKRLRINSKYISIRYIADRGKTRETQRAATSLHFSVLGRLQIEPLLAARPKSLKYREIVADGTGLVGPDPSKGESRHSERTTIEVCFAPPQGRIKPLLKNAALKSNDSCVKVGVAVSGHQENMRQNSIRHSY